MHLLPILSENRSLKKLYKILRPALLFLLFTNVLGQISGGPIRIGAKNFNEGYLLGEILAQLLEHHGFSVVRQFNLGGTLVCFEALKNGEIDMYPEYSGTIAEQILRGQQDLSLAEIRTAVGENFGLNISPSYGFNNTYAMAVKRDLAIRYDLQNISDLADLPDLRMAFSYEFLERQDGWKNLSGVYQLPQKPVGIEHGLAYQALVEDQIDLIDIYSTDGEISRYDLFILEDDRHFFPEYQAVTFYRTGLPSSVIRIVNLLSNRFDEAQIQELNAQVVFAGKPYSEVARNFLSGMHLITDTGEPSRVHLLSDISEKTLEHLELTFIALLGAMLVAIPAGISVYNTPVIAKPLLYISGLLQTIPSIALLALMIPLFGIGVLPAVIALFLYALLPLLRNTIVALFGIDPVLKKVATGIGLTRWQRLRYVEIPLAIPTIVAGIRTAAVINVGTATLAAFIGAGGLGEFIVTGLSLNNTGMILKGAIPAVLLAFMIELIFELIEKIMVPRHLRQKIAR